ncbi:hypothetical protein [Vibrio navarrensis]|uniref:hypothetical protein n=1 Tax=Vibrio navarrensis TaxID=29495 RepID=UPI001866FBB3|nr:hypothetical protein [Vibrio navarrensis]
MKRVNISLALLRGLQATPRLMLMRAFCLFWQGHNSHLGQQAQQVVEVTLLGRSLATQMILDKRALVNRLPEVNFATDYQPLPEAVGAAVAHLPRQIRSWPEPPNPF